ncbi:HAD family hydrolase [Caulobacter sp. KR2-114]|uniref:HAD family hydrolase n=1 Tax=Caulobacter sp. KR2-114 TaxID=3400912 RepID=UPI003BFD3C36
MNVHENARLTIPKTVIFDFDLTLAESSLGTIECVNYALDQMALPMAGSAAIRATIGQSLSTTLAMLTSLTDASLIRAFSDHFVARADAKMVELTTLFPDTAETVRALKSAGVTTAIVSTKFRYRIEAILARDGLLEGIDAIVGYEDVTNQKPHPEGLLTALGRLHASAPDSLYVGDHPIDAEAAAGAEMPFAAVLTGHATRVDFKPWPDTSFLTTLSGLRQLT